MALLRRLQIALAVLLLVPAAAALAGGATFHDPDDPLRSSLAVTFGGRAFDNEALKSYFDASDGFSWTLRYDFRAWRFLRIGAAVTANDKLHHVEEISLGSDEYPIRYSFTAFQAEGELYARTELPRLFGLVPHVSIGTIYGHLHVESTGYTEGYDAFWEELSPATEVKTTTTGWRAAVGCQAHFWANVNFFFEASMVDFDPYEVKNVTNPPLNDWDWSGTRFEFGLMQRF